MFRHRCPLGLGACLLLVLLQVLATPVHAANMARHANGALGYLFCGDLSPAQQEAFRASLPQELLDAADQKIQEAQRAASSCNLCAGLHASDVAIPVSFAASLPFAGRHDHVGAMPVQSSPDRRRLPPTSRGPPAGTAVA